MIFYLYVVDERNHLIGVVSVRELLIAPPSTPLKKIMTTDVISVATDTDQEEVAREVAPLRSAGHSGGGSREQAGGGRYGG